MKCPRCEDEAYREMVDVGVGEIPASDWHCDSCLWTDGDPPNYDSRWWFARDSVFYKATTEWERMTLLANGFRADRRPSVYSCARSDAAEYTARTIQVGGI